MSDFPLDYTQHDEALANFDFSNLDGSPFDGSSLDFECSLDVPVPPDDPTIPSNEPSQDASISAAADNDAGGLDASKLDLASRLTNFLNADSNSIGLDPDELLYGYALDGTPAGGETAQTTPEIGAQDSPANDKAQIDRKISEQTADFDDFVNQAWSGSFQQTSQKPSQTGTTSACTPPIESENIGQDVSMNEARNPKPSPMLFGEKNMYTQHLNQFGMVNSSMVQAMWQQPYGYLAPTNFSDFPMRGLPVSTYAIGNQQPSQVPGYPAGSMAGGPPQPFFATQQAYAPPLPPPSAVSSQAQNERRPKGAFTVRRSFVPTLAPVVGYGPDPAYEKHPIVWPEIKSKEVVRANPKYSLHESYTPLSQPPRPFHCFSYHTNGELTCSQLYTPEELEIYLFEHPLHHERDPKSSNLVIRIQRCPANSGGRFPTLLSHRCRFVDCPYGNINQGQYQVAFDELDASNPNQDPFVVAGYVHLWCLEKFMELPKIVRALNVAPDDRKLLYEKNGRSPMRVARNEEKDDEISKEEELIHVFIDQCRDGTLSDYPSPTIFSRNHEGSLCHRLAVVKLANEPRSTMRQRKRRMVKAGYEGSTLSVHLGDLQVEADIRRRTRMHKNQAQLKPKTLRSRKYAHDQSSAVEDFEDDNGDNSDGEDESMFAGPSNPMPDLSSALIRSKRSREETENFFGPPAKRFAMDLSHQPVQPVYPLAPPRRQRGILRPSSRQDMLSLPAPQQPHSTASEASPEETIAPLDSRSAQTPGEDINDPDAWLAHFPEFEEQEKDREIRELKEQIEALKKGKEREGS